MKPNLESQNDIEAIKKRLSSTRKAVYLKRKMSSERYETIKALNIKGVYFDQEWKRDYPQEKLASHVIGFVGMDPKGLEGIESYYDRELSGIEGYRKIIKDGKSRELSALEGKKIIQRDGYDIYLTLDAKIQYIVEKIIEETYQKYKPKSVSAIVLNPRTGEILSLANVPSYNLNNAFLSTEEERRNRCVTDIYEPGSTFKIVPVAAALNEGFVFPDDIIFCEHGKYKIKGRRKPLHDHKPHGNLSVREVVKKSSNIGTVKIADHLGKENLYDYVKKFGFGKKTGILLPGEALGGVGPRVSPITALGVGL